MPNAFISGTGFYVPPRRVTNDDLRTQYGVDTTHEWIHKRTGIEERLHPLARQQLAAPRVPLPRRGAAALLDLGHPLLEVGHQRGERVAVFRERGTDSRRAYLVPPACLPD